MYLAVKHQVKQLSKKEYIILKKLAHIAKNLANEAIYNARQYYFTEKKFLSYYENWRLLKDSANYKKLQSHVAQQVIWQVDYMFKSFFALLRLKKLGRYSPKVKLPQYLPKDGFAELVIIDFNLSKQKLTVPYSREFNGTHKKIAINVPPVLEEKAVKMIKIIPKANARYFEIQYIYEVDEAQSETKKAKALAIDLGVDNLATCATNTGKAFIIDGRRLKSINQWYNKENARLQRIRDKQKQERVTRRQTAITRKRNNQVNDYISKTVRKIIDFCLLNAVGIVVCGFNSDFQRGSNMGRATNQNFVNIPFGSLRNKLKYLCRLYGIEYHEQEESYTSKASFWDRDKMPVYDPNNQTRYEFSGRRIHRGLYRTSTGYSLNADVNGALNVLRKSNVVPLTWLYARGELDTPARIRIA